MKEEIFILAVVAMSTLLDVHSLFGTSRHDGSSYNCQVIRDDYYRTKEESYVLEYIKYCKEDYKRRSEEIHNTPIKEYLVIPKRHNTIETWEKDAINIK
jgi:hypothetical protein